MRAFAMTALVCTCLLVLSGQAGADDAQKLSIEGPAAVDEGQEATYTISLSDGTDESATVVVSAVPDDGTEEGDLSAENRTITVTKGTPETFKVLAKTDTVSEPDETFTVQLSDPSGATIDPDKASVRTAIKDKSAEPAIKAIENIKVAEGNAGTKKVTLTVELTARSERRITALYATSPGTASEDDGDYVPKSGSVVFEPGDTSEPIEIEIKGDTKKEDDETFYVVLTDPDNAGPEPNNRGDITIENDDASPVPTLDTPSVTEGDSGLTDLVFEAQLAAPHPALTFNFRTATDTASASDFQHPTTGSKLFPANSSTTPTRVLITVKVNGDATDEFNETLRLELLDNSDEVVRSTTGTITDDDNNSALAVADASASEPTAATGTLQFTISLSQKSERPVSVAWRTADGSATAGSDYTAGSGVAQFAPGETAKQVAVELLPDGVNEANETVRLLLSDPQGVGPGKLVDAEAQGTIIDANAPPSLSISDTTTTEGEGATFTVTLAGTTNRTVTVSFGTVDGTAKAGSDYTPRVGTLTFAPGEKTKTLAVTVVDDAAAEPMEDFSMRLGDPQNATITKATGRALIEASDTVPAPPTPPVATPAQQAPAAVKAPRMVLGPRIVSVTAAGVARMTVTCQRTSPIACSGTVELERAARPLLKLGKKTFTVRKGAKGIAAVQLSARSLAILRRNGTMRVRVIVVYKKSVGTDRAVPGIVTLIAPKPQKPKPVDEPTQVEVTP